MVDIEKVIEQSEENIRQALRDYAEHTSQTDVLDDVSDAFIKRLAKDNAYAKQELRELFSQSPVYDAKLDALVINGTRTHDPDPSLVVALAREILRPAYGETINGAYFGADMGWAIGEFFAYPENEASHQKGVEVIQMYAPKAYKEGRKPSRVFKALCQALGVADETAGSEFQRLYAQFADELSAKKIGFKLYVSLNPAHFITMSNPKYDQRGCTLTSCHSFNSTEYSYNNGCTGYARDEYTFIVFTAADPADPETLNNRKTTRQIFAYKPGNGLLLQSRLYNTSGGTRGAQADSKLYRDLVQREISALEDAPNLWKTRRYVDDNDHTDDHCICTGEGFGGYEDWIYGEFHAHVSIRDDHAEDYEDLEVGTYGICICCAEETSRGVYCEDCPDSRRGGDYCADCDEWVDDEDDLYTVHDRHGHERLVCESCRDRYYTQCDRCGEWHENDDTTRVSDGDYVCQSCLSEYYTECSECGEFCADDEMCYVHDSQGREIQVCEDCRDKYYTPCACCHEYYPDDDMSSAHDLGGGDIQVCPRCACDRYAECDDCGELYPSEQVNENGLCPGCADAAAEEADDENETEVSE